MDSRAVEILRYQEQLQSNRAIWEGHWREVAERVRPSQNLFQSPDRPEGEKRTEKIFDDTAQLALGKFAAAVISMTMPHNQRYQRLQTGIEDIDELPEVKKFFDALTSALFRARYAPQSNFIAQSTESVLDVGAFGTGVFYTDDVLGRGIRYKSFPLSESYIAEDANGTVNTLHRRFKYTAAQAAEKFGLDKLNEKMKGAYERNSLDKYWFIHSVRPNPEQIESRKDFRGMRFYSCYISEDGRDIVSEGGFRTFPFATPRFETAPNEVYGRSPAMKVLATIKTLNEQEKSILRATQRGLSPPVMLTDDGTLGAFDVRPDALNYGFLNSDGKALAVPFNSEPNINIGLESQNQKRDAINDAFFVTLFRILVDEPQITATEAMLRAQEKGQLLGPTMGRQQSEFLEPVTQREIDILSATGMLPPLPDALKQLGDQYHIHYQAPLNLAQRAGEATGILNTIQALAPLAQIDPTVLMVFKSDVASRIIAEVNGVPERALNTPDEIAAMKQQHDQAAQAQQLLQAAPVAASAAKDMAQAQSLAASTPNQQAPGLFP